MLSSSDLPRNVTSGNSVKNEKNVFCEILFAFVEKCKTLFDFLVLKYNHLLIACVKDYKWLRWLCYDINNKLDYSATVFYTSVFFFS